MKTIEENFEKFHEKNEFSVQIKKFIHGKLAVNKKEKIEIFKIFSSII
ncbi:hypothetical protein LR002_01850 [Candidatus Gracilibacteria bacterium]|nr:hypothetical protein [Candidatus Gracilibacteria bacterium]